MKLITCFGVLYLLFISVEASAQKKIRIVDQASNSRLPYATALNVTRPAIQYADQNGLLGLEWLDSDSIKITHVGYDDVIIQIKKISNDTIQLVRKTSILANVIIRACREPSMYRFTNSESVPEEKKFGGLSWEADIEGAKIAVMTYPTYKYSHLSRLEFELKKTFAAPKGFPKSPIRFTFYSIDPDTKLPSEPLSTQPVIYYPQKIGKQTVIVDSLKLAVPDSGLYVAIEYLVDKKYCYPIEFRDTQNHVYKVSMQYPLMFDGVRAKEFPLAYYNYQAGAWEWSGRRKEKELDKPRGTIKFGVVYKACD